MPCWNQYFALVQLNIASLSYEIFSLMLNIALSILGSFKLERDKGGNSRACSWCTRKASIKTCSSYWLCQPFSIHGENYSICKFHLSWNVGHWKKLFRQFLWLTCLCFLAAWCSYASPLFLFFFPFSWAYCSFSYLFPYAGFVDSGKTAWPHCKQYRFLDRLWSPFSFQNKVNVLSLL